LLESFKIRDYRYLWGSVSVLHWAEYMELVILSWFILEKSNSPLILGVYGALRFAGTILSPLIGVLVDLIGRRTVLIIVRSSFLLNASAGLLLALSNSLDIWKILVMATFLGLSKTSEMVVRQSLMPDIVGINNLKNGIALERAGSDLTQIAGPIIGGLLLNSMGMSFSYVIVVLSYSISLFASILISPMPPDHIENPSPKLKRPGNFHITIKEGFQYAIKIPELSFLMTIAVIINLTAFPLYFSLAAVVAREVFDMNSSGLGVMLGVYSAGAALGSLAMSSTAFQEYKPHILIFGSVLWHLSVAVMSITSVASLSYLVLLAAGIGQSLCVVLLSTMILDLTPPYLRGRIMGLRQLAVGALPLGLTLSGFLAENFGVAPTLLANGVTGIGLIVGALVLWPQIMAFKGSIAARHSSSVLGSGNDVENRRK
jgi:MFS family permease